MVYNWQHTTPEEREEIYKALPSEFVEQLRQFVKECKLMKPTVIEVECDTNNG